MSGKPTELGYKKDTGRCKFCQAVILWGYMFGKKHPYDVRFDDDGTPHKTGSHMDTCPNWKSQVQKHAPMPIPKRSRTGDSPAKLRNRTIP